MTLSRSHNQIVSLLDSLESFLKLLVVSIFPSAFDLLVTEVYIFFFVMVFHYHSIFFSYHLGFDLLLYLSLSSVVGLGMVLAIMAMYPILDYQSIFPQWPMSHAPAPPQSTQGGHLQESWVNFTDNSFSPSIFHNHPNSSLTLWPWLSKRVFSFTNIIWKIK